MSEDHTTSALTDSSAPASVDPVYAEVLKLFTVLSRTQATFYERARRDVARHELTIGEFAVLEVLYHKGPLLLGAIRDKVLLSSGGITYLVDRLVERSLVERRDCPDDGRARYAALTPEGVALMDRIFPEHQESIAEAMEGLTPEERRTVTKLLKKLGKYAEGLPRPDAR